MLDTDAPQGHVRVYGRTVLLVLEIAAAFVEAISADPRLLKRECRRAVTGL